MIDNRYISLDRDLVRSDLSCFGGDCVFFYEFPYPNDPVKLQLYLEGRAKRERELYPGTKLFGYY